MRDSSSLNEINNLEIDLERNEEKERRRSYLQKSNPPTAKPNSPTCCHLNGEIGDGSPDWEGGCSSWCRYVSAFSLFL